MSQTEVFMVTETDVMCEGAELTGHPAVYLKIDEQKRSITCPYCGNVFKLKS